MAAYATLQRRFHRAVSYLVKLFTKALTFLDGIRRAKARQVLPTSLGTKDLTRVSSDLKRVSVFSAKIEIADALQGINDVVVEVIRGIEPKDEETFVYKAPDGTEQVRRKKPLQLSIPDAKVMLRDKFRELGIKAESPEKVGTIQDPTSDARLDLIVKTQEAIAQNFGSYVARQDETIMDIWPAQELVRASPSKVRRDWAERWEKAGGTIYNGRFIALKDSKVWENLGSPTLFPDALGNPFPPFAFNSGMDVTDITRDEAIKLGVMTEATLTPKPDNRTLAEDARAGTERFDEALKQTLRNDPDLVMEDGVLSLR